MELPIYDIILVQDSDGISHVSLVDEPAMQVDFLKFNSDVDTNKYDVFKYSKNDNDKQIVIGSFIIADKPIYRAMKDSEGKIIKEFYVRFSKDVIIEIVERFSKNNNNHIVDTYHNNEIVTDAYIFQHWIVESHKDKIYNYYTEEEITLGSWVGIIKIDDKEIWEDEIKTGNLRGFSIQINNSIVPTNETIDLDLIDEKYEKIYDILIDNSSIKDIYDKLKELLK